MFQEDEIVQAYVEREKQKEQVGFQNVLAVCTVYKQLTITQTCMCLAMVEMTSKEMGLKWFITVLAQTRYSHVIAIQLRLISFQDMGTVKDRNIDREPLLPQVSLQPEVSFFTYRESTLTIIR